MIIVKLQGGMGNQMFQYAFGKYLASKHQTQLKLDLSFLLARPKTNNKNAVFRDYDLGVFNIDECFATENEVNAFKNRVSFSVPNKILNRLLGVKSTNIIEPHYQFSSDIFNSVDNVYLDGYWQTEKYFYPIRDIIKQQFTVKEKLLPQSELLATEIEAKNAVCVNVRRADFVANSFHGTLPGGFYTHSEKLIIDKVANPHLYIFSDDMDWCYENLKFELPVTFVSHKYAGNKFQDYLRLMSYCKHFIIPNSTFAWWGAYLANSNKKIVITPLKWFNDISWGTKDLLLEDWIKIEA